MFESQGEENGIRFNIMKKQYEDNNTTTSTTR